MILIKIILTGLSFMQYATQSAFWRTDFYWLFIWIIAFHLLWFYVERPVLRGVMLGIIALLSVINTAILPQLPFLLLALLMIDIRTEWSRKGAGTAIGILGILFSLQWTFLTSWPALHTLLVFIGVLTLAWWSAEQSLVIKDRTERQYELKLIQNELEEKADLLHTHMQSMEEVYTLNERNRISRDLHDSVGHTLSTLVIQTAALQKLTEKSDPTASNMLGELHQFTQKGLSEVRSVIHALKPTHDTQVAFFERLNHLLKEHEHTSPFQIYFNHNERQWALNEEQEAVLFRAIQEFLVNSSKHSQATEVRIHLHFTDRSVILTMQDNGVGTDDIKPQMGLSGMEERAQLLGGKVTVRSSLHAGFNVRIVIPKGGNGYV